MRREFEALESERHERRCDDAREHGEDGEQRQKAQVAEEEERGMQQDGRQDGGEEGESVMSWGMCEGSPEAMRMSGAISLSPVCMASTTSAIEAASASSFLAASRATE